MKIKEVLHEVFRNEHRIVLLMEDGTVSDGKWTPIHLVANHKQFFAVVGESPLPQGVFTCREVEHRVLG